MARLLQAAERREQRSDVVEVQPRRRLVEEEQGTGPSSLACPAAGKVAGKLEPLSLTSAQGGHGLAQGHVGQPHGPQRLEKPQHLRAAGKELAGLGHGHVEHVGNRPGPPAPREREHPDLQHFGTIAPPVAVGAAQVHVAQELHLDALEAVAGAGRTTPLAGIEAEGSSRVAALPGQRLGAEETADRVQSPDVAGGIRAGGLADRRLIHQHNVVDQLVAPDPPVHAGGFGRPALELAQGVVQHVMHQGGLAGTADPGDAHDPPEGNRHVDSLEVVLPGCQDLEAPRRRGLRPGGRHPQGRSRRPGGDPLSPREVVRGQGIRCVEQPLDGPEKHHLSAPLSGPGAQIKHQVGGPDELRVVLDHDESVAGVAQAMQDPDQPPDVPGVQPDTRLVEDEKGVHE